MGRNKVKVAFIIDCVRLAKDNGLSGSLEGPSSYMIKSPPVQHKDHVARRMVEEFIAKNRIDNAS